ncbi:TPA: GT-D fold domain-containing glycosyltransferase [Streptococcus suis]
MIYLIKMRAFLQKKIFGRALLVIYRFFISYPLFFIKNALFYFFRNTSTYKSLKDIHFTDDDLTFQHLKNGASLTRFGDGEIAWLFGKSKGHFGQLNSRELSNRLMEVISAIDESKLLIGVPNLFGEMRNYSKKRIQNRNVHLLEYGKYWSEVLDERYSYADSLITRVYNGRIGINHKEVFSKWKSVWKDRDVVLIEGEGTRFGVGNDLLINAKSVSRIIAPKENAFEKYLDILTTAQKFQKDVLFLIALGPTATILVFDLVKLGFQAIDIGHLDIEYEWFLRQSSDKVAIEGKYVNEVGGMSKQSMNEMIYANYLNEVKYYCI